MKNSKHTKGIWEIKQKKSEDYLTPISIKSNSVVIATVHYDDVTEQEQEANAKLIASAPELLEALEKAKAELIHHILSLKNQNIFLEINNAINKATE